jgi:poly(3-hydroxybutyrate) depolymerase
LKTVRLRDFSKETTSPATLLCAPFALHGASTCDFAPGHSLVATLRRAGLRRLFVTDWRTATTDMRLLGIDQYLADVKIGGPVDLIGLCQGGWMALVYAARFPTKVRSLVLAGAPVDIQAAPSALSELAHATPLLVFQELVRIGDGIVPGAKVMKFWGN